MYFGGVWYETDENDEVVVYGTADLYDDSDDSDDWDEVVEGIETVITGI